ncbi:MAG: DUF5989 family protein [Phycisphaerae bacterium]
MSEENNLPDNNEFARESETERVGIIAEFWDFLKHNKKWWLLPILIAIALILILVAIAVFGGGSAAPFIYPLF